MYNIRDAVNYIENALDDKVAAGEIKDFDDLDGEVLNLIMIETDEISRMLYRECIPMLEEKYNIRQS